LVPPLGEGRWGDDGVIAKGTVKQKPQRIKRLKEGELPKKSNPGGGEVVGGFTNVVNKRKRKL